MGKWVSSAIMIGMHLLSFCDIFDAIFLTTILYDSLIVYFASIINR